MPWLEWLDRQQDVAKASDVPYRLLEPIQKHSYGDPDSPNMLIKGDNLDALKSLLPYYGGQVKCIFIDPPYNKGWLDKVSPLLPQWAAADARLYVEAEYEIDALGAWRTVKRGQAGQVHFHLLEPE